MSNYNYELCIRLLGELEGLPGKDIRTTNIKRVAKVLIKKLKTKNNG